MDRASVPHTPCYCEENAHHLCRALVAAAPGAWRVYVAVLSNKAKAVPVFHQRASTRRDGLVVWDYHVLCVASGPSLALVYDLDTTLGFPCGLAGYCDAALGMGKPGVPGLDRPMVRVIPAAEYVATLSSDRSHMRGADGSWLQPPPPGPALFDSARGNNLGAFIDMDGPGGPGEVMTLDAFARRFS